MADSIFLLQGEDDLIQMESQPYDSEALLQTLLAKFPDLLAGGQIDSAMPRRWLLIKREMGIPAEEAGGDRWSVDHLFLDQDGIPTLIEVKRSSDSRIRRAVVGQMLDYAANAVVFWPVDVIQAEFGKTCDTDNVDPEDRLAEFLGDESDPDAFWRKVKTNLQAGNIRMLFVADEIPPELRRVVEFLNEQMDPAEVLAVEIKQYLGQGMKTLVPRLIGQTAEAARRKVGTGRTASALLEEADQGVKALYEELNAMLCSFGNDVQVAPLKKYIAFKRNGSNFASVVVHANELVVFVNVNPDTLTAEQKAFAIDMRNKGHWGTGDLKVTVLAKDELARATPLLKKSYEDS
jgi:predicted transport protein